MPGNNVFKFNNNLGQLFINTCVYIYVSLYFNPEVYKYEENFIYYNSFDWIAHLYFV